MLMWIFGNVKSNKVSQHTNDTASGYLELERANVNWFLSIDANSLPAEAKKAGKRTFRSMTIDGNEFEFSEGFTELHTKSYEEILKGNGFPIIETRKSIEVAHEIRKYRS